MQTTDASLGGTGVTAIVDGERGAEGDYALSIERDRMATTVTITVQGEAEDDDVKFMQAMDFGDGRTMHTRAMDADEDGNVMTEVVIVSTDIEERPRPRRSRRSIRLNANPNDATRHEMNFQSLKIVGTWAMGAMPIWR